MIQDNGNEIFNTQPGNVLPDKARVTGALTCMKGYVWTSAAKHCQCAALLQKGKSILDLVSEDGGGSEEHMPLQGVLNLFPGMKIHF